MKLLLKLVLKQLWKIIRQMYFTLRIYLGAVSIIPAILSIAFAVRYCLYNFPVRHHVIDYTLFFGRPIYRYTRGVLLPNHLVSNVSTLRLHAILVSVAFAAIVFYIFYLFAYGRYKKVTATLYNGGDLLKFNRRFKKYAARISKCVYKGRICKPLYFPYVDLANACIRNNETEKARIIFDLLATKLDEKNDPYVLMQVSRNMLIRLQADSENGERSGGCSNEI